MPMVQDLSPPPTGQNRLGQAQSWGPTDECCTPGRHNKMLSFFPGSATVLGLYLLAGGPQQPPNLILKDIPVNDQGQSPGDLLPEQPGAAYRPGEGSRLIALTAQEASCFRLLHCPCLGTQWPVLDLGAATSCVGERAGPGASHTGQEGRACPLLTGK